MLKRNILYFLCWLGFWPTVANAQFKVNPKGLLFSHITTKNGLSYDGVNCIFQDSRGFIWIGTNAGLNCYDGNSIKTFHHRLNDSTSLADEMVFKIAEDKENNLWITTNGGVSRLNLQNDCMSSFTHTEKNPHSLADDQVRDVLITKQGKILFATGQCLDEFDTARQWFVHLHNHTAANAETEKWNNQVAHLYEDSKGRIWVATYRGFFNCDVQAHSFQQYICPPSSSDPVLDNLVTGIFEDHTGQLWLSTWAGGLKKFYPEQNKFETYKWDLAPAILSASNIVLSIGEAKDHSGKYHLWLGTPNGLAEFDREKKEWSFYKNEIQNSNTINNDYVPFVYTDHTNLLWLGTGGGVNLLDPNKQFFTTHKFEDKVFKPAAKSFGQIMCMLPESAVNWVATWYGNALYELDSNFNLLQKWHTIPPNFDDPNNYQISDITRNGNYLWISTFNGLVRFDEKKNEFKSYLPDEHSKKDFPSAHVIRAFIDTHGRCWVFFYHKGFSWFNPQTGVFTRAGNKQDGNNIDYDMRDILEDNAGNIWLAMNDRILVYNYKMDSYTRLDYPGFLPRTSPNCLFNDHTGKIWLGTNGGIVVIDPATMRKQFIIERSGGLSNNNVLGILEDRQHRIWIATSNGLNLYNPADKSVRLFTRDDGLESNDLTVDFRMAPNGRFLIGGSGYITEFNPDSLSFNQTKPPVVITGLKIFADEVQLALNAKGEKEITISYKQNEFSFDFAVLNFTNPSSNRFYCFMEGFDKSWRHLNKGVVSYTNLDPGEYILRVKGANNDGVLNEKGDFVRVIITPPYWKTWWFRIAAMFLISAFIAIFVSYRINLIRREEAQKTEFNRQIAETKMQALRAQMNPHFIFNSLNSIQECVVTGKNEEASAYLSKFAKLVRMILENSSKERITLTDEIEYLKLYLEVESLRFSKDFSFEIKCAGHIETDMIRIPPMLIQPYIENALWHGLVHKTGEKRLQLAFSEKDDVLICTIEDNGIGREAAKAYRHTSHRSVAMKNTAERLELLGNKASLEIVDLAENSGTIVILNIPI